MFRIVEFIEPVAESQAQKTRSYLTSVRDAKDTSLELQSNRISPSLSILLENIAIDIILNVNANYKLCTYELRL